MSIDSVLQAIQDTPLATLIRENDVLFPTIESIHVLGVTLVVGSIAMVDLRLLGIAGRNQPVSRISSATLPWTWAAFAIAATAGSLLFSSQAVKYFDNIAFRMKFILLLLAGINMIAFQLITYRGVAKWDVGPTPVAVKLAGGLSLALWVSIVACGRWIGFTMFG